MLAEVMDVVGGVLLAVFGDGAVTAEVDDNAQRIRGAIAEGEDADFVVYRPGGTDDLRIHLARMGNFPAVAHEEAAIEMDAGDAAEVGGDVGCLAALLPRLPHR